MHEYSIIQALMSRVEAAAAEHGAIAVHRIEVRIGAQSGVEIDLLQTAFETFRDRSICARAEMTITTVPAEWSCPRCGDDLTESAILVCQTCQLPARLAAGDEIILDRIEMEAA